MATQSQLQSHQHLPTAVTKMHPFLESIRGLGEKGDQPQELPKVGTLRSGAHRTTRCGAQMVPWPAMPNTALISPRRSAVLCGDHTAVLRGDRGGGGEGLHLKRRDTVWQGTGSSTHRALVGLLARVSAHVHDEHVLRLEGLLLPGAGLPAAHKLLLLAVDVLVVDVLPGKMAKMAVSLASRPCRPHLLCADTTPTA